MSYFFLSSVGVPCLNFTTVCFDNSAKCWKPVLFRCHVRETSFLQVHPPPQTSTMPNYMKRSSSAKYPIGFQDVAMLVFDKQLDNFQALSGVCSTHQFPCVCRKLPAMDRHINCRLRCFLHACLLHFFHLHTHYQINYFFLKPSWGLIRVIKSRLLRKG